jgi:hypothetical protein
MSERCQDYSTPSGSNPVLPITRAVNQRFLLLSALQIKQNCPHMLNLDHKFCKRNAVSAIAVHRAIVDCLPE